MAARAYTFTDFKNRKYDTELIDKADYMIMQKEICPTTNKKHIQGYVHFTQPVRLAKLKKWRKYAHFEKAKGNVQQNIDYCSKEDTRYKPGIELGTRPQQGKRNDLVEFKDAIKGGITKKDLFDNFPTSAIRYHRAYDTIRMLYKPEPRPREVTLIYGPTGVGKTRMVLDNYPGCYQHPIQKGFWFDLYDDHEVVLLDDFAGTK